MLQKDLPEFSLPDNLRDKGSPDLRLIVSDGATIYFSLGGPGLKPNLLEGIRIDDLESENQAAPRVLTLRRSRGTRRTPHDAGSGDQGSRFIRLELSVTAIARDLPLG